MDDLGVPQFLATPILWVNQYPKYSKINIFPTKLSWVGNQGSTQSLEHLPLSFGSPGWQKSRFPWSKAVKELRWHEIRFPAFLELKKKTCSFCIWEDDSSLQSKNTFCSVVLFPRVVYGGPIEALNHHLWPRDPLFEGIIGMVLIPQCPDLNMARSMSSVSHAKME